ncbi:hypothetical protein AYJ02_11970 [Shewanella algae]|nr:hypothetical protein AYJ02_11970 [Shewanella algae]
MQKIDNSVENWENGILGNEEKFAEIASDIKSADVDEMMSLQMISIRLQKGMIKDLKDIARIHGLGGYQPLIRRVLERFVEAEMKAIAREQMSETQQEVSYCEEKLSNAC